MHDFGVMNINPASLFRISYRMERSDYVALSMALTRRDPLRIATLTGLYVLIIAAVGLLLAGSVDAWLATLANAFSLPLAFVSVPLVLTGPVILALRPQISGLVAALGYRRYAIADRDIVLDLTAEGIEGGATDLYSRIGWAAVRRLIETPRHLFIQISPREALAIPRRAIANEDQYRNILGFIRARTGLSTR